MKIISIDVGIKNLAYCIIDNTDGEYKIVGWDVINLCGEPPVCNRLLKKGKCTRAAKFQKDDVLCCKGCAKKTGLTIPTAALLKANYKRTKLAGLKKIAQDHNIPVSDSAKKQEIVNTITDFIDTKCLESITTTSARTMSLIDVGIAMRDMLSAPEFLSVDKVLIENQISPIANRMKTVQGMLAQFFIMNSISDIEFVSASNKLKPYIGTKKTTYKERKALGISITMNMLVADSQTHWIEHMEKHSKKDDLADSFLQGIWFLTDQKLCKTNYTHVK